ncbi:DUF1735 and LamG domain-containing protein [Bacteroides oleiciplenus]|uniref:DUF1735 domain-containing protein n=1 Tax=Bacteroides oleiciplenus TaxID=626931 RepID=A0A3E5BCK9_9BACE|nr:DUF1735 and LamG domain-containing protein [Bacteroides oleiciplenus]MBD9094266.1 DUF1735 domain-containing protein [Bacteroides oleiciplenus]RGN35294.1 DUF1735 domain-containing protein [Bacteroides oleiciplenus]
MKLKNLYLVSIALLAGMFAACSDDTENFDNRVYISTSVKASTVLLKTETAEGQFQLALAKPEEKDINVSLKADMSLVEMYNAAYYDKAQGLPAEYYSLENTELVIPAGTVTSEAVMVKFKNLLNLDSEQIYVLPVTIEQAGIDVLQSARTMYYVLKGAALINVVGNITKNSIHVDWKKPEVANNLRQLTAEALIRVSKFDKMLTTIMGIEGGFLIRIGDAGIPQNQLQIANPDHNVTSADLSIPTGEWVHIAVTYDADAKKMIVYINGKNKLEDTVDCGAVNWGQTMTDEGNGFWIGHSYNRDRWLEGEISECRIWNRVLTADEINAKNHFYLVEPDSEGLAAYWKFDEGTGQTVTDYTGNGNNGMALDPISWVEVALPEK